ncbi:hypothetical protein C7B82_19270 [Stenomitos frigidus ULC18]|uniref:Uncharacterized protein n=1 Tax=Stenomitos frigidus ULC18 TaxID=2107698 RepID=A0A2T1E1P8_9CYAN|nr:hypothetical protein C7B82_19270 [Stenomitos frigidus ULC18]
MGVRVLTDPEKLSESWEADVWAPNLHTAQSMCEAIAGDLTEVINVTQVTKKPTKQGEYKFICWFKAEITNDGSNT